MKRILLLSILMILGIAGFGQKFAFVDSDYILKKIPQYRAAQEQLDKLAIQYQKEVEDKFSAVDEQVRSYQTEKVLLTQDMRSKREQDLMDKQKEAQNLQRNYFGPDGVLFKKRTELIKPVQDQVYNAVKDLASEGGYAAIFDVANNPTVLFSNSKYDKSDEVLQKLGYR
ncbi:OmpH family outer membrane protein [Williamwhitmania taraxaci]|uniref:Periplasmic chaperone for outer membrane proteins Skp n=1 Tax=Williamwhitmania taraxaci TaxID=1640674 RepID=A0A1G6HP46_9BACT|nr:OmpH family outer membrane protein [Williamwhitmania taraxaci]SDB95918.1 periplasmic chaperone for outer membrane proteins Skp [Williamwhitmania taraxaci]